MKQYLFDIDRLSEKDNQLRRVNSLKNFKSRTKGCQFSYCSETFIKGKVIMQALKYTKINKCTLQPSNRKMKDL